MVNKKTTNNKNKKKSDITATKVAKEVEQVLSKVKTKYNSLDPEIKKKIVVGVTTVAALLTTRAVAKKIKKRRKK